jgi:hypothetical protein
MAQAKAKGGRKKREVRRGDSGRGVQRRRRTKRKTPEYIYAYDPLIGRRFVHVVVKGWAVSMATGRKFRFKGLNNLAENVKEKRKNRT